MPSSGGGEGEYARAKTPPYLGIVVPVVSRGPRLFIDAQDHRYSSGRSVQKLLSAVCNNNEGPAHRACDWLNGNRGPRRSKEAKEADKCQMRGCGDIHWSNCAIAIHSGTAVVVIVRLCRQVTSCFMLPRRLISFQQID